MIIKGIIGATILISATTIDDAVWLVPYTTSSHLPLSTKIIHGITFILTLECLSIICVGFYSLLKHGLFLYFGGGSNNVVEQEVTEKISFILQLIGVIICWSIAIFLYIKKILKRRRRERDQEQQQQQQGQSQHSNNISLGDDYAVHSMVMSTISEVTSIYTYTDSKNNGNNAYNTEENILLNTMKEESNQNDDDDNDDDINTIPTTPSIPLIISFTTLGALDEISYFPALIMGKIFTPVELCVGAVLASILILGVVTFFLARCKPLVEFLDSIPLYGIVGLFAIVLTLDLLF